jgi:hypothetical protein
MGSGKIRQKNAKKPTFPKKSLDPLSKFGKLIPLYRNSTPPIKNKTTGTISAIRNAIIVLAIAVFIVPHTCSNSEGKAPNGSRWWQVGGRDSPSKRRKLEAKKNA